MIHQSATAVAVISLVLSASCKPDCVIVDGVTIDVEGVQEAFDVSGVVVAADLRSARLSTDEFEIGVSLPTTAAAPLVPDVGAPVAIPFLSTGLTIDPGPEYHSIIALTDDVVWLETVSLNITGQGRVFPLHPTTPERCIGFDGYEATVAGISFDGDDGAFLLGAGEERAFHRDGVPFVAQVFRAEIQDPDITIAEGLERRLADQ